MHRNAAARSDRASWARAAAGVMACACGIVAVGGSASLARGEIYLGGRGNSFGGPTSGGVLPAPSTYTVFFEFAPPFLIPPGPSILTYNIPLGTPAFTKFNITSGPAFDLLAAELTNGIALPSGSRFYLGWAYWNAGGAIPDNSENAAFFLPPGQIDFAGNTITRFELTLEVLTVNVSGTSSDTHVQSTLRVYGNPIPAPGAAGLGAIALGALARRRRR